MKVNLYSSSCSALGRKLQETIESAVIENQVRVVSSLGQFSALLRQPINLGSEDITILMASDRQDLQDLLAIRHLLAETRLILVLPDNEKDTVAKGHLLRPRFLSFAGGNFSDIGAVVSKMLSTTSRI